MIDDMMTVLLALFGAMVVGETARPIVNRLAMHMSRPVATAAVFGALFALLAAMAFLPIQLLVRQIAALIADLPQVIPFPLPPGAIQTLAPFIARDPLGLVPAFSVLGLTLVMALFWLGASEQLSAFALTLLPANRRDEAQSIFSDIGTKLGAYVGGTVMNAAIVVVLGTLGLIVLHVPNAFVLGLFQGVLVGIPYLGTFIAVMTVLIVTGTTEGWLKAAEAGALVAIVQTLVGTFVSPLIFKKRVDVDPLGCVVSGAVGGTLFGIPGIILAVPAASVVKTVVVRVIAPAIRRRSIAIVLVAYIAGGACAPAKAADATLTGNEILIRATRVDGVTGYTVAQPVPASADVDVVTFQIEQADFAPLSASRSTPSAESSSPPGTRLTQKLFGFVGREMKLLGRVRIGTLLLRVHLT